MMQFKPGDKVKIKTTEDGLEKWNDKVFTVIRHVRDGKPYLNHSNNRPDTLEVDFYWNSGDLELVTDRSFPFNIGDKVYVPKSSNCGAYGEATVVSPGMYQESNELTVVFTDASTDKDATYYVKPDNIVFLESKPEPTVPTGTVWYNESKDVLWIKTVNGLKVVYTKDGFLTHSVRTEQELIDGAEGNVTQL